MALALQISPFKSQSFLLRPKSVWLLLLMTTTPHIGVYIANAGDAIQSFQTPPTGIPIQIRFFGMFMFIGGMLLSPATVTWASLLCFTNRKKPLILGPSVMALVCSVLSLIQFAWNLAPA